MSYDYIGSSAIIKKIDSLSKINLHKVHFVLLKKQFIQGEYRIGSYEILYYNFKYPTDKTISRNIIDKKRFLDVIVTQNGYRFLANITCAYYNPRYSFERDLLSREITGEKIVLLGGGIGVFGFYLSSKNRKIISLDLNPEATRLGLINRDLNKTKNISFETLDFIKFIQTDLEYSCYLTVLPQSIFLNEQIILKTRPGVKLILYLKTENINELISNLAKSHLRVINYRPVKDCSKLVKNYRIIGIKLD